ncbi:unnamed protein product, partial [Heterosigma akashiwo]
GAPAQVPAGAGAVHAAGAPEARGRAGRRAPAVQVLPVPVLRRRRALPAHERRAPDLPALRPGGRRALLCGRGHAARAPPAATLPLRAGPLRAGRGGRLGLRHPRRVRRPHAA